MGRMTKATHSKLLDTDDELLRRDTEARELDDEQRAISRARAELHRQPGHSGAANRKAIEDLEEREAATAARREKFADAGKKLRAARAKKLERRHRPEHRALVTAIVSQAGALEAALDAYEQFHDKVEAHGDVPFGERLAWDARYSDTVAWFVEDARMRGFIA